MKVSSHLSLHEDVSQAPVSSKGKGSTEKSEATNRQALSYLFLWADKQALLGFYGSTELSSQLCRRKPRQLSPLCPLVPWQLLSSKQRHSREGFTGLTEGPVTA